MVKPYFTIIIAFTASMLFAGCLAEQCEDFIRKNDINVSFSGTITDNYFDESNRGTATFILSNGEKLQTDTHTLCCFAQPGDSIWKKKGSLKYYLKRNDSIATFYPECGNIIIKDTGTQFNEAFQSDCGKRRQTKKLPINLN